MVSFKLTTVLSASATLLLASLQVSAQSSNPFGTDQIPSACKNDCQSLSTSLQSCTTTDAADLLKCICSDSNAQALAKCFGCAVDLKGSGITEQDAQTSVNQYIDGCNSGGISLKPVSVASGNGNGALTSNFANVGMVTAAGMGALYALL